MTLNTLPTTWQSLASIGRRSTEISRWKKRKGTSAVMPVKHKPAGNCWKRKRTFLHLGTVPTCVCPLLAAWCNAVRPAPSVTLTSSMNGSSRCRLFTELLAAMTCRAARRSELRALTSASWPTNSSTTACRPAVFILFWLRTPILLWHSWRTPTVTHTCYGKIYFLLQVLLLKLTTCDLEVTLILCQLSNPLVLWKVYQ